MRSFTKSQKKREYKERGQIRSRRKWGMLEKKKDYRVRARDYNEKKKKMRNIQEKIFFRNKDEFYPKMISTKSTEGIHDPTSTDKEYTKEELQLMKTQDVKYIQMKAAIDQRKADRLSSSLSVGLKRKREVPESDAEPEETNKKRKYARHTIFVDNQKELNKFNVEEYFDTLPQFIDRPENRPRKAQLKSPLIINTPALIDHKKLKDPQKASQALRKISRDIDKDLQKNYREMDKRREREKKLSSLANDLQTQKHLLEKKKHKKITHKGVTNYVWARERKR
jgi:U3 small nucleolar RNA-associated protein 11